MAVCCYCKFKPPKHVHIEYKFHIRDKSSAGPIKPSAHSHRRNDQHYETVPMTRGKFIDTRNYLNWNDEDILRWIMSLDDGLFNMYEDILRKSFREEGVTGKDLNRVEPLDIKCWGIMDFRHKKSLYEHIQSLIFIQLVASMWNQVL